MSQFTESSFLASLHYSQTLTTLIQDQTELTLLRRKRTSRIKGAFPWCHERQRIAYHLMNPGIFLICRPSFFKPPRVELYSTP